MLHSKSLYSPEGLDLFVLISSSKSLSSEDSAYILKTFKASGAYFRLQKLQLIVSRIKQGELFQCRSRKAHRHLVNLNTRNLEGFCGCKNGELKRLLGFLETLEVIEVNDKYKPGAFSRSYAFTDRYRHRSLRLVPLAYPLRENQLKHLAKGSKNKVTLNTDLDRWLYENVCRLRLSPKAIEYTDLRHYESGKESDSKDYAKMFINAINAEQKVDQDIVILNWFFKKSHRVGRSFTPIISLHKDLRAFLRLDREKLLEIDQHASQPFLLLGLYREMQDTAEEVVKAEAAKYFALWKNGDFYQDFVTFTGSNITAKEMKDCVIKGFLNCKNPNQPPRGISNGITKKIAEAYETHFPLLHSRITKIKTERDISIAKDLKRDGKGREKIYSQFGIKLQKMESGIFIDGVAQELMDRHIFCYTVHDAIGCLEKDVETVKEVIARHLEEAIGYTPSLKVARPKLQQGLEHFDV